MDFATYTLDDNYLYPFAVSAISVKKYTNLGIRILQCPTGKLGLSPKGLETAIRLLKLLDVNYEIKELPLPTTSEITFPIWDRFPASTWIRFIGLFSDSLKGETLFYLEPDVLLTSNFVLPEIQTRVISARSVPGHTKEEKAWHGPEGNWYFNCGVMFVEVDNWQQAYNEQEFWSIVSRHDELGFRIIDQDSINYLIKGRQEPLSISYNTFPSEFKSESTKIIHFAGGAKPWIYASRVTRLKLPKSSRIAIQVWDQTVKELYESISSDKFLQESLNESRLNLTSSLRRQLTLLFPRMANNRKFHGLVKRFLS